MTAAARNGTPRWPGNGQFALTIMDDTDRATVAQSRPLYDALIHYGLRTTKTIWPLPTDRGDPYWGEDLTHDEHRAWLHRLLGEGFEISFHGARSGGSPREVTHAALERFREEFGEYPATFANHASNAECLYWGQRRFDVPAYRAIYRSLRTGPTTFYGDREESPYYWADLCRGTIRYVRNFTFAGIATSAIDRFMPYHDPRRPFVRAWFSASEGGDVEEFVALLSDRNVDRLRESGEASIVYTHSAKGFVRDGRLDPRVERILSRLASTGGWFVPVRTLLERLEEVRGVRDISPLQHAELESRWILDHAGKGFHSVKRRFARRSGRP